MLNLSDREKAIIVVTGVVAAVLGIWLGLWIVPSAALDVPKEMDHDGDLSPAYTPVPTYLPVLSLIAVLSSLVGARNILRDPDDSKGESDSMAADGGEVNDGQ